MPHTVLWDTLKAPLSDGFPISFPAVLGPKAPPPIPGTQPGRQSHGGEVLLRHPAGDVGPPGGPQPGMCARWLAAEGHGPWGEGLSGALPSLRDTKMAV